MNAEVFVLGAAAVFGIGLYGLLIAGHLMRKLLALNLMVSAVFLLLLLASEPIAGTIAGQPDPLPQALILTGIVIAVSTTAFALALMVRYFARTGQSALDPDSADDD